MKSKVVIIGQNYNTSYGVIRALGEAGYRCEVGKRIHGKPCKRLMPELKSKYIDKYVFLMTREDSLMVQDIISSFAREGNRKVLIPTDDFCAALVDRNLATLQQFFYLPNINGVSGEVSKMMDKFHQKEIIRRYGLTTADICVVDSKDDIKNTIPQDIEYPCFIKPLSSAGIPKYIMRKCNSYDELVSGLNGAFDVRDCKMLIERFVEIEKEYTIPGIAVDGEVMIPSLIEKSGVGSGAHKGVTISGKVLPTGNFENLVGKLEHFIKDIGFTGIFDIEILYSKGNYYFNELNLRYGAAGYALTASGINLPAYYVESLQNGKVVYDSYSVEFQSGLTFVNEKAAFEYYQAGYSGLLDFLRSLKEAEQHFMLTRSDAMVTLGFLRLITIPIFKKLVKKVLRLK